MSIIIDLPKYSFTHPASFKTSSFFQGQARLRTPQEVRATTPDFALSRNPNIATRLAFPDLQLFVKYGPNVNVSEGQASRLVSHYLSESVPMPEVCGWDRDGGDVFLYMQLIDGVTLSQRWPSLSMEEKDSICDEIKGVIENLKILRQPDSQSMIATYGNWFHDLRNGQIPGPFCTVKGFHDWFSSINLRGEIHDYRSWLPDNVRIVFAHADIHRENLIVSGSGPPKLLAVVDWGQAGWYPEYWEYCKARLISDIRSDWYLNYIHRIFGTALAEWYGYGEFFFNRIGPCF